jgi:hypothetical protein
MKMKRFLACLLTLLFALCSFGCGGGENPPPDDGDSPEESLPVKGYEDMNIEHNEAYVNTPFYNDKNDSVAYVSNAMWKMFGLVNDGQDLVLKFGNEATWFEWLAEKVMWSGDDGYISQLKSKMLDYPQVDCGFLWSWTTTPYWTVSGTNSLHYDGTFRYIAAVYDIIKWENSTDFLEQIDTSSYGSDLKLDASKGKTVYEKTAAAMDYILNRLNGKNGEILITADSVLMADGKTKFFDEWNNTGRFGSGSSNYWDNLCFGNYDAYENALFYQALNAMSGIERMRGNDEKAAEYDSLAETVKRRYDELYWDETAGRYINTIDADGVRRDYGLTFQNFEALKYGLGDTDKAKRIFEWVDGVRTVEGDTSTGSDIMSYTAILNTYYEKTNSAKRAPEGLKLAARSNTVAFESKSENGKSWWHNPGGIDEFSNASYNTHLENGGYIFYTAYYELMARLVYQGADASVKRMQEIAEVYEYNLLNSDVGGWMEGLVGEFPESGLVPVFYFYGLMGLDADADGLRLFPSFGTAYETLGVSSLRYGGITYAVEAKKDGSATIKASGKIDLALTYRPAAGKSFKATAKDARGQTLRTLEASVDENGEVVFDLTGLDGAYRVNIQTVE